MFSVNQKAPSGPTVMFCGPLLSLLGSGYSAMWPVAVMRPIRLPLASVNQMAPSGPLTRSVGVLEEPLRPVVGIA